LYFIIIFNFCFITNGEPCGLSF